MNEQPTAAAEEQVICKPALDPAIRWLILGGMLLGVGVYCFIDGYVRKLYPYKPAGQDINAFVTWAINHFGPYLLIPPGLVILGYALVFLRRRLLADRQGIGYAGRPRIAWDSVRELDARSLQAKGILYLHHETGTLKLDSWKLNNFRQLVAFVEKHVPQEKHKL